MSVLWRRVVIMAILLAGAACGGRDLPDSNAFLLRSEGADVGQVAGQAVQALATALQAGGALQPGYPAIGRVVTTPDPSDAEVERMVCAQGAPADFEVAACILLNQDGDFVRVMPITWQSAAFYMYRIYVAPRSPFARVQLARDFIAIDLFLMQEPGLWEAVARAVSDAADRLGARPFRP